MARHFVGHRRSPPISFSNMFFKNDSILLISQEFLQESSPLQSQQSSFFSFY